MVFPTCFSNLYSRPWENPYWAYSSFNARWPHRLIDQWYDDIHIYNVSGNGCFLYFKYIFKFDVGAYRHVAPHGATSHFLCTPIDIHKSWHKSGPHVRFPRAQRTPGHWLRIGAKSLVKGLENTKQVYRSPKSIKVLCFPRMALPPFCCQVDYSPAWASFTVLSDRPQHHKSFLARNFDTCNLVAILQVLESTAAYCHHLMCSCYTLVLFHYVCILN